MSIFYDKVDELGNRNTPFIYYDELVTLELLRNADVRNVTRFLADIYGNEYDTAWHEQPELVEQYYNQNKQRLSLYLVYKFNNIVQRLLKQIDLLKGPKFKPVCFEANTVNAIMNLAERIEQARDQGNLKTYLTASPEDFLTNHTEIVDGMTTEVKTLYAIVVGEINNYDEVLNERLRGHERNETRSTACFDTISNVLVSLLNNVRMNRNKLVVNYREIADILGILYRLRMPVQMLYPYNTDDLYKDTSGGKALAGGQADMIAKAKAFSGLTTEEALVFSGCCFKLWDAYQHTHDTRYTSKNPSILVFNHLLSLPCDKC